MLHCLQCWVNAELRSSFVVSTSRFLLAHPSGQYYVVVVEACLASIILKATT